ncbi:NADH-quinone oxidoreductase subunit N [Sediminibacterium soli]|uniref:NADH-quinone oxidoreductase subunit N n=1 Tax=Sediminibacterium soli TaxID=2698829 RepID=UPI001379B508|nr:NADH-quinone oxidoreductase subunit N [Sediminibacterium soli]NCI47448.1 NADH-quinone oxidoreductase subunit N [Sediminibacterium soli]
MNAIIVSALLGVLMMFSGIWVKNRAAITNIAAAGLLLLVIANLLNTYGVWVIHVNTHGMLEFQQFGLFFNTIAFTATLLYVLLSGRDMERTGADTAEYYALVFFVLCGVSILTSFNGLLMLFLGIEILSIPLYILTGADKKNLRSNEASLKYFLMGCFSTGILLMGITLIYGATGNFSFGNSQPIPGTTMVSAPFLEVAGILLVFVSMAFKVSAAPFHFWTPDVYDGAPSVFTSFMATVVKAAGFIAFVRLFSMHTALMGPSWRIIVTFVIIATLLVGNITAVFQQSVKRMLAYSSIAQAGFMLFALYSDNDLAKEGILLYSIAYSLATIGIFAILIKMNDYTFDGFNGLAKTHPVLAAANTVFLLSLAGIPLTAGFFAKYYMLASAVKAGGSIWLVIIAVIFAAVSVYYYFRVIQAMYFKEGTPSVVPTGKSFHTLLIITAAAIILIGLFPSWVLNFLYF